MRGAPSSQASAGPNIANQVRFGDAFVRGHHAPRPDSPGRVKPLAKQIGRDRQVVDPVDEQGHGPTFRTAGEYSDGMPRTGD